MAESPHDGGRGRTGHASVTGIPPRQPALRKATPELSPNVGGLHQRSRRRARHAPRDAPERGLDDEEESDLRHANPCRDKHRNIEPAEPSTVKLMTPRKDPTAERVQAIRIARLARRHGVALDTPN